MSLGTEAFGTRTATSGSSKGNEQLFVIEALLSKVRTSYPVKVLAVTNSGGVEPIGYVDLEVLITQLDGDGNAIPHTTIYNAPYLRVQGGRNAVILDPQVGDIGIASFASQDMSGVKVAKGVSPPGSKRRHHFSDAIYLYSIIAGAPDQYVRFYDGGIETVTPDEFKVRAKSIVLQAEEGITSTAQNINQNAAVAVAQTAPVVGLNGAITQTVATGGSTDVQLVGPVNVQQQIHSDTDVTADTISLKNHLTTGVQSGTDLSGGPV